MFDSLDDFIVKVYNTKDLIDVAGNFEGFEVFLFRMNASSYYRCEHVFEGSHGHMDL